MNGSCTRILEVDKKGCVVRWEWNGNDCPFMEVFEYSNWRNKSVLGFLAQKGCGCGGTGVPDKNLSSEETKKVSEDAPFDSAGRFSSQKETCSICGKTIPRLEQHFKVNEKIICKGCFAKSKSEK